MIVLDTNVLSELMRLQPDSALFAWVAAQPRALLYTTSINKAEIVATRRREGRPIEAFDAQIAAAARVAGADLATRDVRDFAGCGLTLVNPWDAG